MNKRLENFIQGLNEKDLKYLYNRYCNMAFNSFIDCDKGKYAKIMEINNLIDETLRERGIWVKKNEK